jgi:Ni/Fe-hydrogenase 1 B-type cytochrome subunit
MVSRQVQRILVWNGWHRLAHWLIALSVIVLIATGWLVSSAPSVAVSASDYHDMASVGLILGLALRLGLLLFGPRVAQLAALVPVRADLNTIGLTLRFYATLARSPVPKCYAHNPLWAPLYLLLLLVLTVQVASGLLMEAHPVLLGFYLPAVHADWATVILVFTVLHVIAVTLHDAKGTASDVSAMINGHRIFVVEDVDGMQGGKVQTVSLDRLGGRRPPGQ